MVIAGEGGGVAATAAAAVGESGWPLPATGVRCTLVNLEGGRGGFCVGFWEGVVGGSGEDMVGLERTEGEKEGGREGTERASDVSALRQPGGEGRGPRETGWGDDILEHLL